MYVVLSRYYASDKIHEACGTLTFLLFINAKVFLFIFITLSMIKYVGTNFLKREKKH